MELRLLLIMYLLQLLSNFIVIVRVRFVHKETPSEESPFYLVTPKRSNNTVTRIFRYRFP
jgi:hypothetical protein